MQLIVQIYKYLISNIVMSVAIIVPSMLMSAIVSADDHRWEASAGLGYQFFDSERDLDDSSVVNLGVGYVLDEHWTLEALLTDFETELDNSSVDFDGRQYRLDALYHLSERDKWQPYLVLGVGEQELDPDHFSAAKETLVNLGVGVKRQLSDKWQLRGDARAFHSLDEEHTDYGLNLAVNYMFGASLKAAKAVLDEDKDGVADSVDSCLGTSLGVAVDSRGCPLDGDGDGVYDSRDQCPETAAGLRVDAKGCAQVLTETVSIKLEVNFDTDSAHVKEEFMAEIQELADFMGRYLHTVVTVEGHTDDRGAAAYNQVLSQKRADAVRRLLIERMAIDAGRVEAIGYGEAQPIASNESIDGRLNNRRVVAKVSSERQRTPSQ